MTVLFLANIGSSDLQLDDGQRLTPPREAGRELLDRWDDTSEDLRQRLQLPILVPSLREVLAYHDKVHRLVLFATDQEDTRYRHTDTLHFADLARRWLQSASEFAGTLGEIGIDTLDGTSPATYDDTFAVYASRVAALDSDDVIACYVAVTGGTAAMNMALIFHAVRAFQERCQAIYKRPDPDDPAFLLEIGLQLRCSLSRQAVVAALERRDFAAALALMTSAGDYGVDLVELTRYASQRLNFDFDSARGSLGRAIAAAHGRPALRALANSAKGDLDRLRARDLGARLAELTHNAAVAYGAQHYVSFLGRVFRFQEAVLRWVMEKVCDLPTDESPCRRVQTQATWKERIEAHPKLLACLQRQERSGRQLDYTRINLATMKAIAEFVRRENQRADGSRYLDKRRHGRFTGGLKMLKQFSELALFRNRTIIAHDFEGVSLDILTSKYSEGRDPVRDLYQVLTMFDVPASPNPFDSVAEALIREINQLA